MDYHKNPRELELKFNTKMADCCLLTCAKVTRRAPASTIQVKRISGSKTIRWNNEMEHLTGGCFKLL